MPVRKLPKALVEILRKMVARQSQKAHPERIYRTLLLARNIDHRYVSDRQHPQAIIKFMSRVKVISVKRQFPQVGEVVIKKVHGGATAQETIDVINFRVKFHNERFKPKNYMLLKPNAYAIGEDLVAMAKTDAPAVAEILSVGESYGDVTNRGTEFFERLKKKYEIQQGQLRKAADEVRRRTNIAYCNLLLLGYQNGKFIFMPLVDIA